MLERDGQLLLVISTTVAALKQVLAHLFGREVGSATLAITVVDAGNVKLEVLAPMSICSDAAFRVATELAAKSEVRHVELFAVHRREHVRAGGDLMERREVASWRHAPGGDVVEHLGTRNAA